jgi:NAD(P)-dependent dehydrogenase (short-subunit alcohol dehydrogenase family)
MKGGGWGRIVNFGSGSVFQGTAGQSHYAAAKAGVLGRTRSLVWTGWRSVRTASCWPAPAATGYVRLWDPAIRKPIGKPIPANLANGGGRARGGVQPLRQAARHRGVLAAPLLRRDPGTSRQGRPAAVQLAGTWEDVAARSVRTLSRRHAE